MVINIWLILNPGNYLKILIKKIEPETILNIAIQITASISILCEPFMPLLPKKIKNMLNTNHTHEWSSAGNINQISEGHLLNSPELLFSRIEDEQIENQINKLKQS